MGLMRYSRLSLFFLAKTAKNSGRFAVFSLAGSRCEPGFLRNTTPRLLIIFGENSETLTIRSSRSARELSFRGAATCPRKTRPELKLCDGHGSHSPGAGVYIFQDLPFGRLPSDGDQPSELHPLECSPRRHRANRHSGCGKEFPNLDVIWTRRALSFRYQHDAPEMAGPQRFLIAGAGGFIGNHLRNCCCEKVI
jgi:hypothetical protein